jgi:exopolysaccharide production protein ExoQ
MSTTALIRRPAVANRSTDEPLAVSVPRWETAFVCFTLFLSTNALLPVVFSPGSNSSSTPHDPISHKAWLLIFVVALGAAVRSGRAIVAAVTANPAIAAICYLALSSTFWSAVPGTTLKYGFELGFSTLLGLFIGVRFGIRRLAAMLSWTTAALILLSAIFAIALPRYGIDTERGNAWRGVFLTKNELARITVIGLVVWTVRVVTGDTRRIRGVAMMVAFAVVGLESGSRTALGVTGLMLGVFMLMWLLSVNDRRLVPLKGLIVAGVALAAAAMIVNLKLLLTVVGSDYSLTGRAGIWEAVWNGIKVHPWLGYGFHAFWRGAAGPSYAVWRASGVQTPHSHNGFLDLFLDLGIVGLLLFAVAYAVTWRRALAQLRGAAGSARLFPVASLSLLLLYNLTESSLVSDRSLDWIVFVAIAGAVGAEMSPRRARAVGPVRSSRRRLAPVSVDEP